MKKRFEISSWLYFDEGNLSLHTNRTWKTRRSPFESAFSIFAGRKKTGTYSKWKGETKGESKEFNS